MKNLLKKLVVVAVMIGFGVTAVMGQTQQEVAEAYNEARELRDAEDHAGALAKFMEVHKMATALGDSGEEIKTNCEVQIPTMQYKVAFALYKAKKIQDAIDGFEKTIEVSNEYGNTDMKEKAEKILPKLHNAVAGGLAKKKDFTNAISHYDQAIAMDADYSHAYYGKALVYKAQKDEAGYLAAIAKVIEINDKKIAKKAKKNVLAYFLKKGQKASGAKKYNDAIVAFNKALEYDAKNTIVYLKIAEAYNGLKDFDKAIETAEAALEVIKNGSEEKKAGFYYQIAESYKGKGDNTSACDYFKKASVGKYLQNAEYQIKHVLKCK